MFHFDKKNGHDEVTPLHLACGYDSGSVTSLTKHCLFSKEHILFHFDKNTDVNLRGGHDEVTPLHLACRYDSGSATQLLLTQRADINAKDIKGRTALHYATRRGHDLVTKVLGFTCIYGHEYNL